MGQGGFTVIGLNTLVREFGQPLVVIEWVVLAYMLTVSSLMLSIGRLGDILGKKKLYLAGIIIFTIGSVLCGLSPTIYWLITFRVLQAVGSSILMALGTASVVLALVANRIFAKLDYGVTGLFAAAMLHALNILIAMFSPTIHTLRLHYVEFFTKFYRPEGRDFMAFGARPKSWEQE